MRIVPKVILALLICSFGCGKSMQTEAKSFLVVMERNNAAGICDKYKVSIEPDGKSVAERTCSNRETEKIEKRLNAEELKKLIDEIKYSEFFSFEDDYSRNSKNCPYIFKEDAPGVIITVKLDGKEKTINHYHGCFIKREFHASSALQPLNELEYKIDELAGTENWSKGQK